MISKDRKLRFFWIFKKTSPGVLLGFSKILRRLCTVFSVCSLRKMDKSVLLEICCAISIHKWLWIQFLLLCEWSKWVRTFYNLCRHSITIRFMMFEFLQAISICARWCRKSILKTMCRLIRAFYWKFFFHDLWKEASFVNATFVFIFRA